MFDLNGSLEMLNKIQSDLINGIISRNEGRSHFHLIAEEIKEHGYGLKCHKVRNQKKYIWSVVNPIENETPWVRFAPPCDHKNQCTTRSIFYCINQTIPYNDIRKEQEENARKFFTKWNCRIAWEKVLTDRGYVKIILRHKIRRDRLAYALRECGRILSHSSSHCAAIHNGKVYDSWDSSRGRVDYILVEKCVVSKVISIVDGKIL